jgi:hypothetical protein
MLAFFRRYLDFVPADADARDDAMMKVAACLLFLSSLAFADGGKLQFQRKAGVFNISLFATPSPVREGRNDLSVMVQNATDQSPVLDADVSLRFVRRDKDAITSISAPARHDQSANKLLYAAQVDLNVPTHYRVEISVQTKKDSALVTGDLDVLPPEPPLLAHWPYVIALPVVAFLFVLNQRLKRKRRAANPQ